jgi:hypothetical protein
LEGRIGDPELGNRFRVVGALTQCTLEVSGDGRPAHAGDRLDLLEVGDRHDARDDRHGDAGGAGLVHELEVELVVEEELGDQEARARLDFPARVLEVLLEVGRVGVNLREAGRPDAEVEVTRDHLDQLHRVVKAAGVRLPLCLAARGVAAQCQHVLDSHVLELAEDLRQPLLGLTHAREVRHRLDPQVLLDPLGDLDRALAGAAAGAVGHGHVLGPVVLEHRERVLEGRLALVGLRREELEREDRALLVEDLVDSHQRGRLEP